jgi:transcriptional regulator with XRE-family HTH domain
VDIHVEARLRHRREQLGLSQLRLAEALGLSYQLIQKYERGATRIWIDRLYGLAEILKVEVAWFFDGLPQATRERVVTMVRVKEIERAMAARSVTVVHCPISGGPPGARAGTCRSSFPATRRRSSGSGHRATSPLPDQSLTESQLHKQNAWHSGRAAGLFVTLPAAEATIIPLNSWHRDD